jgi:hypothetical protein
MQDPQASTRSIEIPGPPAGELPRQLVWLVLLDHPNVGYAAVDAVGQREVDQPVDARKREGRLRALVSERREPVALTAREHQREHPRPLHLSSVVIALFAFPAIRQANTAPFKFSIAMHVLGSRSDD